MTPLQLATQILDEVGLSDLQPETREALRASVARALELHDARHEERRRELARARSAVRESEELKHQIIENVPGGVVVVSPTGAVLEGNAEALDLLGLREGELTRRHFGDFRGATVREDGSPFPVEEYPIAVCLATGERAGPATIGVRKPAGELVWAVFTAVPLREPGTDQLLGAVVSFLDVTELKRSEAARRELERSVQEAQRLESLGLLAGGVAHDFNNLLVGMLGHIELAAVELEPTSEPAQALAAARRAALRASELTHQLLAYSGRGKLLVERLDLDALVRDLATLAAGSLPRSTRVELELHGGLPAVEGDATQLRQVALNLLTNASEALEGRAGRVLLRTDVIAGERARAASWIGEPTLDGEQYAALEVIDEGCGVAAEGLPQLFEPFFTTKFTGRGLGLAAVLGVLRAHGGAVAVESTPGRGATFRLVLPGQGEPVAQPRPEPPPPRPDGRGEGLILVIDDEEHVRSVARRALEAQGYAVLTAASGREGVELLERSPEVRLALIDLLMSGMDGVETYRALREVRPDLPVVLSSGFGEASALERFGPDELAGFLPKPYTIGQLGRLVEDALRR